MELESMEPMEPSPIRKQAMSASQSLLPPLIQWNERYGYILSHVLCMVFLVLDVILGWCRYHEISEGIRDSGVDACGSSTIYYKLFPAMFVVFQSIGTFIDLLQAMILAKHLRDCIRKHEFVHGDHICNLVASLVLQYLLSAIPLAVVSMVYQRHCGCHESTEPLIEIFRCLGAAGKLLLFQWILHAYMKWRHDHEASENEALPENEKMASSSVGCGFCYNIKSSATVAAFMVLLLCYVGVMTGDVINLQSCGTN